MSQSKENKVIIDGQTYYGGLNQPNLKFIKVNVDCWEKIFDFLALCDILAMSQTCQRMRQIGGHYFRENFPGTACELRGSSDLRISVGYVPLERDDFLRFVGTIEAKDELKHLRTLSNMGLLSSLTTLRLHHIDLNENQLHDFESIQTVIETIELRYCSIQCNSFGKFLASCPKLKCLRFHSSNFKLSTIKTSLFRRTYPMLEYFECTFCDNMDFKLSSFLKQNSSIKTLQIGSDDLCKIRHGTSTFKLDYLIIQFTLNGYDSVKLANRLKILYTNGFYKTLHVLLSINQTEIFINEMASFGALKVLYAEKFYANLYYLPALKELYFWIFEGEVNLERIAMNLINLERLWIGGNTDDLLPFLRHSKTLKMIVLDDRYNHDNTLNLSMMNEMRRMSGIKRKIRIGVYENQYLATKCDENNLNYDFIEITRVATLREHFEYKNYHLHY